MLLLKFYSFAILVLFPYQLLWVLPNHKIHHFASHYKKHITQLQKPKKHKKTKNLFGGFCIFF